MSAQEYVEAIARELSRLRGRGLLLSPADSALALSADDLLAGEPSAQRDYWSLAVLALLASLREMGRAPRLECGAALRERRAPRPPSLPRKEYRRALQLQLLAASSERLSVPPRAFLL